MPHALLIHEPPDGGVPEHVLVLADRMRAHGWHATVAGPAGSAIATRARAAGLPYVELRSLRRGFAAPRADAGAVRSVLRLIRRVRPDLVHCHSSKAGLVGRLAGHRADVPAVYTPNCFGFVGDVSPARRVAAAVVERGLGRWTKLIICVSQAERRHALERNIADDSRLEVIPNGVDPATTDHPPDPALAEFRGSGLLVGAVAVLREQKRLDLLVDAAPAVLAAVPDARIAIVGNGPLQAALEERASRLGLGEDPRFRFFPFRTPSARYLGALDVFVLCSGWEGLPIAVLEALAHGVPQVLTRIEGTEEAGSEETAELVAPGDPDALAGGIIRMLRDPARRAAAQEASVRRQRELFDVDQMVARTVAGYDRVLGRPVGTPVTSGA